MEHHHRRRRRRRLLDLVNGECEISVGRSKRRWSRKFNKLLHIKRARTAIVPLVGWMNAAWMFKQLWFGWLHNHPARIQNPTTTTTTTRAIVSIPLWALAPVSTHQAYVLCKHILEAFSLSPSSLAEYFPFVDPLQIVRFSHPKLFSLSLNFSLSSKIYISCLVQQRAKKLIFAKKDIAIFLHCSRLILSNQSE